jgi:1-deoxy-D-xylulose-5-phosphate synthase
VPDTTEMRALPVGRGELRREGRAGIALLAFGTMLTPALALGERLDATVANMRFVKPLDEELVLRLAMRHEYLVTLEENVVAGGAGSAVLECLQAHGYTRPVLQIGLPDRFIEHGSREQGLRSAGLDPDSLAARIEEWLPAERRSHSLAPSA